MEDKKRTIIIITGVILIIACLVAYFVFANKKYTITFNTFGGSNVETQKVKKGETVKKPNDPTKEGYVFIEWDLGSSIYDFNTKVSRDMTLKAIWKEVETDKVSYTISFNTDGANTIQNQIIEKDGTISKPTDPIKEGYKFIGWYSNGTLFDFNTKITSNIELTAKWEKETTTTTKKADNTSSTTKKVEDTTKKTDKTTTTTKKANTSTTTTTTKKVDKYTVTFDTKGGNTISKQEVTSGNKATKPSNPTKEGYTFKAWTLDGKTYDFNTKVTKNITLEATYTAKTYTVKVTTVDEFSPERKLTVYEDGKQITVSRINYTDGTKLCDGSNAHVNKNDIAGESKLQLVLKGGTKVTATIN